MNAVPRWRSDARSVALALLLLLSALPEALFLIGRPWLARTRTPAAGRKAPSSRTLS